MTYIAIDIDSTLYDFTAPFRQAFFDLAIEQGQKEALFKGGYHSWVEWRSPADVCGMDAFLEALDRVHSPEVISTRQPYEGSVEVVTELADHGNRLLYVSNRDPMTTGVTTRWLADQGFPVGVDVICSMSDKSAFIQDCAYLIDDRPKTLCDFVYGKEGRKAFGLMFEYNRALTDIPNIYLAPTWGGLRYYLEDKGVLSGDRYSASVA